MPITENDEKDAVSLLQKLVQNKCINPPGNEMNSINTIKKYLDGYGIESQVFETGNNRGNLFAEIKGNGNGKSLMLGPAHVDVVPIGNPDAWDVDPFEGAIKNGYIYGRGTLDMLFIVVSQVQAFVRLHEEGFKPNGNLRLLIVADEEAGGNYGMKWIVKNKPDLLKVDYAISEAGGIPMGDDKLIVTIGEKGMAWRRIEFKGTSGHGSSPYKSDNAVVKAGRAADRLQKYNPPLELKYVKSLVKGIGMNPLISSIIGIKMLFPFILKILHKSSPTLANTLHAISRMTISPNIIHGGLKTNLIPGEAYIDVDIRTLPGQDSEYVHKHIMKALGDLASDATIMFPDENSFDSSTGTVSELDATIETAMKMAIKEYYPDVNFVPLMVSGATDLRFIRDLGGKGIGFSLFDPSLDINEFGKLAHGPNEKISEKTVSYSLNTYYNLCKLLLK